MAELTMEIKIDGLDDMRRLSAALEQYNAGSRGDAAQINRLEAHLTEARDELAYAYNIIKNRNMRLPDSSYKTDLLNEIANLVDRDLRREMGADHAETKQQLAVALDRVHQLEQTHDQQVDALRFNRDQAQIWQKESISYQAAALEAIAMMGGRRPAQLNQTEVNNKLLRQVSELMRALEQGSKHRDDECRQVRAALGLDQLVPPPAVIAAIDALQVDASMKQHTIEGLRRNVYDLEQQIAKAAPFESDKKLADALKMRLAEANDTITKQAGIIKHLHEEYHQLQARKQGAEFDLERAKEEIAFAEAEAAKYKPLIEAVRETGSRGGALFIAAGHWVELTGWATATDEKQYTRVELSGSYLLGARKCL